MQSRDNETLSVQVLRPELGNTLAGSILSSRSCSWVVRTKTDSGRVASNINSRLTYKQIPGSVERHNTGAFAENILYTLQSVINLFSI